MFKRFYKNRYGYSRWDGTQRIEGLDADDILDALSDEYIEDGNLSQALRRLMPAGIRSDDGKGTMGLRGLMSRMRTQRIQQLNRSNLASGLLHQLREKLEAKGLPEDVLVKLRKELNRLERMPSVSPEGTVIRNYIDWILALPWTERTTDVLDIGVAENVLNEDHYGLEKIKERILEFMAVRQLTHAALKAEQEVTVQAAAESGTGGAVTEAGRKRRMLKGPIRCFVGPPGVGKTSLGQSIARSLGRKFERMSLGGMHDEAELRGHRRTYIGAMPGRLLQAIRRAGVRNPVLMLDEIDKLGRDYRGDPASAMLEALEPEKAADIVEEMAPDEAADILSELEAETSEEILDEMDSAPKTEVRELLAQVGDRRRVGLLAELRAEVARYARKLAASGLVRATQGNLSARDDATGQICITPSGADYDTLGAEDIVVVALDGGLHQHVAVALHGQVSGGDVDAGLRVRAVLSRTKGVVHGWS